MFRSLISGVADSGFSALSQTRLSDVRVTCGAGWRACVAVPAIFDFVRQGRRKILKEVFLKFTFLERNSDILQRFCSNR